MHKQKLQLIFLLTISCLSFSILEAQQTISKLNKWTHAKNLKNGVLLVRLQNSGKKIKLLREAGYEELATKTEEENKRDNEFIINAFKKNYFFSEFYFYDSFNAKLVVNGVYDHIIFDSSRNEIEFNPKDKSIYVAEYGFASTPGSTDRYNTKGILIRYINDRNFERINHKFFFSGSGSVINPEDEKIERSASKLNKRMGTLIYRWEKKQRRKAARKAARAKSRS